MSIECCDHSKEVEKIKSILVCDETLYDVAELFKPVLSDALIFKMVRKRMIRSNWFKQEDGVCLLSETGRQQVASNFSIRLEEMLKGRTYREWIYREALNLERHVMGVAEYESFKRRI